MAGAGEQKMVCSGSGAGSLQLEHGNVWVGTEERGACRREAGPAQTSRCLNSLSLALTEPLLYARHYAVDSDVGRPLPSKKVPRQAWETDT